MGNWIFLIAKSITIILNKHIAYPLFLFLFPFLLFSVRLLLASDDVGDDLFQIFIIELWFFFSFVLFLFLGLGLWREDVCARARYRINGLLQFGIDALSSLVFEDAGRVWVFLGVCIGSSSVLAVGEVEIIGEVAIKGMSLPVHLWTCHCIRLIEGVSSVVFGLLEDGCFIVLILFVVVQHVLLFLWDEKAILEFGSIRLRRDSALSLSFSCISGYWFFFKVIEGLNKFLCQEALVLIETATL